MARCELVAALDVVRARVRPLTGAPERTRSTARPSVAARRAWSRRRFSAIA